MLVLTRKKGETIRISEELVLHIVEIETDRVRVGLGPPPGIEPQVASGDAAEVTVTVPPSVVPS